MPNTTAVTPETDQEREVLTKAVLRCAELMGLRTTQTASVLGLSKSTLSRMNDGSYLLKKNAKEWELAALLIRLYRSLDAIMAGDLCFLSIQIMADFKNWVGLCFVLYLHIRIMFAL